MGGFAWTPLAVPYVVTAAALVALGVVTALIRGDGVLRLALIGAVSNTLPWATASAAAACARDPDTAARLYRLGIGPVALLGPTLMLLVLGAFGQTERYRKVLIAAGVASTLLLALTWTTPLVVESVMPIPSGLLYPHAGPLNALIAVQLVAWPAVGYAIARRTAIEHAPRMRMWHVVVLVGCAAVAASDVLLTYGVAGYYPLAWLPALGAVAVLLNLVLRADLLRARGLDRDAAVELALLGIGALVIAAVIAALHAFALHPLALSAAAAPVAVVAGAIAAWSRARRIARAPDAGVDTDRVDHQLEAARDHAAIAAALARAFEPLGVTAVRLWYADAGTLRSDGDALALDPALRVYLIDHPALIVRGDLPTSRLGAARPLVEALARTAGPDLVVPLFDRDQLLGVVGARLADGRVLRDAERAAIERTAGPAARALAYVFLRREAETAVAAAREAEVADAVATQAGTRRRADLGEWRLAAAYRAAERVAGDTWTWERTADGKLALLVADVAGRGVPAALVSSALAGAFAAAIAGGAGSDAGELAEVLARTIADLARVARDPAGEREPAADGRGSYRASAFIAVLDHAAGVVDWVAAGHRGGAVVRPGAEAAELVLLTGAGAPLGADGARAYGRAPLATGELLVVVSDGVIELRDARGQAWGERRFAQLLRGGALAAGDQAAPLILDAALAHAGDTPPSDDLLVIAVEPS